MAFLACVQTSPLPQKSRRSRRTAARIHGHPHGVDHGRHWQRHLRSSS